MHEHIVDVYTKPQRKKGKGPIIIKFYNGTMDADYHIKYYYEAVGHIESLNEEETKRAFHRKLVGTAYAWHMR